MKEVNLDTSHPLYHTALMQLSIAFTSNDAKKLEHLLNAAYQCGFEDATSEIQTTVMENRCASHSWVEEIEKIRKL